MTFISVMAQPRDAEASTPGVEAARGVAVIAAAAATPPDDPWSTARPRGQRAQRMLGSRNVAGAGPSRVQRMLGSRNAAGAGPSNVRLHSRHSMGGSRTSLAHGRVPKPPPPPGGDNKPSDIELIMDLQDQLAKTPHNADVRLVLAESLLNTGWYEAAQEHIAWLAKDPLHAESARRLEAQLPVTEVAAAETSDVEGGMAGVQEAVSDEEPPGEPREAAEVLADAEAVYHDATRLKKRLAMLQEIGMTSAELGPTQDWVDGYLAAESPVAAAQISSAQVAQAFMQNSATGLALAIDCLKQIVAAAPVSARTSDNAELRRDLLAQVALIDAACGQEDPGRDALMHLEHEVLGKKYRNAVDVCTQEDVAEIDRENFLVCEDNTAYDMAGLAPWLRTQSNLWTHPTSREPLSQRDVRDILRHPLGRTLIIERAANDRMAGSISHATLREMQRVGQAMLDDLTQDFRPSHAALAAFRQHLARLPRDEQDALRAVRPAVRDAHTRDLMQGTPESYMQAFEANEMCGHKVGQFLRDAAYVLMR